MARTIVVAIEVPDNMTFEDLEQNVSLPADTDIVSFRVLDDDDMQDAYMAYLQSFIFSEDSGDYNSPLSYKDWKIGYENHLDLAYEP